MPSSFPQSFADATAGDPSLRRIASVCALAASVVMATACGGGGGSSAPAPSPTPSPAPAPAPTVSGPVTISGVATYDSVPNAAIEGSTPLGSTFLDYANTRSKPIRGALVQVLDTSGAVLPNGTAITDANGAYSVTVTATTAVTVRVRAELQQTGSGATWDFKVEDNTNGNALYVLDSVQFPLTASTMTENLRAASGWGGSSYTGVRAAGPFAILDTVYQATQKVLTAAPNATFPPLTIFWSPNNTDVTGNISIGQITTSYFTVDPNTGAKEMFLLGKENTDTDEYDTHVVAHEWGHYLQSSFSRDDSVGGSHGGTDKLDMRVAFSEGWGNAWSGIAFSNPPSNPTYTEPVYADSNGFQQSAGFSFSVATPAGSGAGWYKEQSSQYLIWSLYQNSGVGFPAMFNALAALPSGVPFTSLYSFGTALTTALPAQAASIRNLYASQNIVLQDAYGTGETNNGGITSALPVYNAFPAVPGSANYCVTNTAGWPNKLDNYTFAKFVLPSSGPHTFLLTPVSAYSNPSASPEFSLVLPDGSTLPSNASGSTLTLAAGNYSIALDDASLLSGSAPVATRCFTLSIQ